MDYASAAVLRKHSLPTAGAFTFGIEEEYFLVEAGTKLVPADVPAAFFDAAKAATDGRASTEFLQPQIEVISSPHVSMADARAELRELRRTVAAVAAEHGLASKLHREHVEAWIEPDDELALLARDGLGEPVREVGGTLHDPHRLRSSSGSLYVGGVE